MLPLLKKVGGISKKIFVVVLVYIIVITLFVKLLNKDRVFPQANFVQTQRNDIYSKINDTELSKTSSGRISIAIYRGMTCGIVGEGCTDNPSDGDVNYYKSLQGKLNSVLVMPLSNPPASGIYWAKDALENSGFIPKTYAAEGIGFAGLKPLINLWKVFRDLAYMILVLILVAIGFMIMFRMKLNPQTVISIENALPKIVVSMILITFSFAIAGFLIDLTYILIAISISILSNNNLYYDAGKFQNEYLSAGMTKIYTSFYPKGAGVLGVGFLMYMGNAFFGMLGPGLTVIIRTITAGLGVFIIGPRYIAPSIDWLALLVKNLGIQAATFGLEVGGLIQAPSEAAVKTTSGWIGMGLGFAILPQLVIGLLIFFTILMNWFRIFFMLFRAYLQILLMVIFAPIFMLLDAVPGQNAFSGWFKGLLAELLTFPLTIILLLTGYVIVNTMVGPAFDLWQPPLLAGSVISSQAYAILVGMGLMFMVPDLVKFVKDKMGVKPLPFSVGLGTFFGGAGAAVGGGMGLVGQFGSISMAVPGLRRFVSGGEHGRLASLFDPNYKPGGEKPPVSAGEQEAASPGPAGPQAGGGGKH